MYFVRLPNACLSVRYTDPGCKAASLVIVPLLQAPCVHSKCRRAIRQINIAAYTTTADSEVRAWRIDWPSLRPGPEDSAIQGPRPKVRRVSFYSAQTKSSVHHNHAYRSRAASNANQIQCSKIEVVEDNTVTKATCIPHGNVRLAEHSSVDQSNQVQRSGRIVSHYALIDNAY